MIYGNIHAKETETAYTPVIRKALDILRTTDVSEMHHGKYPLDGDRLILQINEVTTGPKNTRRPEVHRQYIDVQYMVHGHELIGFYPDCHDGAVREDHLEDNHYAYGAVVDWVYEKAAGIRPAAPGFRRGVVEPVPTGRLDWLEASIDTVSGRVSSRWEHVDGKIRYEISLPVAGEVVICGVRHNLPAGSYVFWSQAPRAGTP